MDKDTRNRIQRATQAARAALEYEYAEQLEGVFDIRLDGTIVAGPGEHLDAAQRVLRTKLVTAVEHQRAGGLKKDEAVAAYLRDAAFTTLNRFVALKMLEAREIVQECISRGDQSSGFKEFMGLAPGLAQLPDHGYRVYIETLFDELSLHVRVLFNRRDAASLLWPRRACLDSLLTALNSPELAGIWAEDETIGWIYQYYNDEGERKKMREESSAPRNSRELAVRNQFFTPRYVVEFLTDNTLGRLWYEMTRGETVLRERCHYLVRRPTEIFLKPGESAQESAAGSGASAGENLSQEELLRQPVHIPHRPLKDPCEIRLLDPACGSMHFGLYAFDLFTVIYDEAWEIAHGPDDAAKSAETFSPFVAFAATFPDKAAFLREVPRLIVERNIHGIDIDLRAAQIAGLSLWLRAQRAWHQAVVKPADRPRITRSNLVCAEPMPGEKELLREFVEQQFPVGERPAFAFLLEKLFDRMTLAGEAGSLLRIEEEIRTAIADAKRLWKQGPRHEQALLFSEPGEKEGQGELRLDLSGITDAQFWERAEQRIYDALEAYAEQAEDGGGFQRRLFANDTAQGFAFIDLFRKRYDVVVMNPPFGAFAKSWKAEAVSTYPNSSNDIYAAFIERFLERLAPQGRLGAITSRACFFTTSFIEWRENVIGACSSLDVMIDLGEAVMDGAMVEAAAYILTRQLAVPRNLPSIWMREFRASEREQRILDWVAEISAGELDRSSPYFVSHVSSFSTLTGKPFVYWIDPETIRKLSALRTLEQSAADVRKGLRTGDNFRFVRCLWEIPPHLLTTDLLQASSASKRSKSGFVPLVLSGSSQPWFAPILVALNWQCDGKELRQFVLKYGGESRLIQGKDYYYRPGISWTRRATRFIPYAIPSGCIPTGSRPMAFPTNCDGLLLLAVTASNCASAFMRFYGEKFLWPNFLEGKVKLVPWPTIPRETSDALSAFVAKEIQERSAAYREHEPFHSFLRPEIREIAEPSAALQYSPSSLLGNDREAVISNCYGLSPEESSALCRDLADALATRFDHSPSESDDDEEAEDDSDSVIDGSPRAKAAAIFSYIAGVTFGRWDIRYATDERPEPELPDPFAPLPVCPPGMLQGDDGLPLSPEAGCRLRAEGRYPLDVAWDGILVDDPEHPLDLERRVRAALAVLWGDRAEALEHEACALLGVPNLREWFRRPAGFFADHLKRYSKSRRKAPIYWPLSTTSGSYTPWLYYHRFSKDMLYRALEVVQEKLSYEERKLLRMTNAAGSSAGVDERAAVAEQESLVTELQGFQAELTRVAPLWNPNLNDGVILNYGPLWRMIGHKPWQKAVKTNWDELVAGKYDWAHLAMHLWPERVMPKCATDRSLAIAHGLEDAFWYKDSAGKWQPRKVSQAEMDKLIKERTSAAVKDALKSLLEAPARATTGTTKKTAPRAKAMQKRAAAARPSASTNGAISRARSFATADPGLLSTVKQAIAANGDGASRADVIDATGITSGQWNMAIKALMADGSVTQTGERRGARYHLPGGNA